MNSGTATFLALILSVSSDGSDAAPCERHLEEAARVGYAHYETAGKSDLGGMTVFHLDYSFDDSFSYRYLDVPEGRRLLTLAGVRISMRLTHTVNLPAGLRDSVTWYRRLRRHELDHVAVSADERPRLILGYLVAHLDTLSTTLPHATPITTALIQKQVSEAVAARHAAVVALLQANYNLLDSLTVHGTIALPDREAFFRSLYERPNLVRLGFPWVSELAPVFALDRYRNAPRPRCD